jgi:hypothetical protein
VTRAIAKSAPLPKAYSKDDLRKIFGHLSRLLPPGGSPLNAEEIVDVGALLDKTKVMIATHAGAIERGPKILEWRIPKDLAPTMNECISWDRWRMARTKTELGDRLRVLVSQTKGADLCGAKRMRWVRVTRFTNQSKKVDDAAVDAIGGKLPVDRLVQLGVLAKDDPSLLKREAHVGQTQMGNVHLLVEVFEIAAEEVPDDGPKDAPVVQIVRKRGRMTRAITGEPD